MKYLVVWYYDRGFSNGTEVKFFVTLEDAKNYLNKHRHEMWDPGIFKQVEVE